MLAFKNANKVLKETALVTTLAGSGGATVVSMGATCTVEAGTGSLFFDFSSPTYGFNPGSREQPVTLYNDAGWYEEAYIVARTGDNLTISRRAVGQEYGVFTGQVFATLPVGTKIAPMISARTLDRFIQRSLPIKISNLLITPDAGVTLNDNNTTAIGINAVSTKGTGAAIGPRARCHMYDALVIGGYPVIAKDDDMRGLESAMTGVEGLFSTISMSMTGGIAWAPNTVYQHGEVFRSNPDNGLQWTLYCGSWNADQIQAESTTTEPPWSNFDWDYIDMDFDQSRPSEYAYLVSTDWEGYGYEIYFQRGMTFFPLELTFICDEWVAITVAPKITFKVMGTTILNNVTVDGITGANQRKTWALNTNIGMPTEATEGIKIILDDRATGTKMRGRFLLKGIFIEDMKNPPLSYFY